jgi:hypothetical protein
MWLAILPAVVDVLNVMDFADHVEFLLVSLDDSSGYDVPRFGHGMVEQICQTEQCSIQSFRQVIQSVAIQHHLVDKAQLMVHVFTNVPVHSQKWVAAKFNTDGTAAHSYSPQHRQHVCASKADGNEIGIFDSG